MIAHLPLIKQVAIFVQFPILSIHNYPIKTWYLNFTNTGIHFIFIRSGLKATVFDHIVQALAFSFAHLFTRVLKVEEWKLTGQVSIRKADS